MFKRFVTLLLVLTGLDTLAQSPASVDLRSWVSAGGKTPAETAVNIGKRFLGVPYVPHTLDQNPTEQLVVTTREFDCTTYLETVLALSLAYHELPDKSNQTRLESLFRKY